MRLVLCAGLLPVAILACVAPATPDPSAKLGVVADLGFEVRDFRGDPAERAELPRRPRLRLLHPNGFRPEDDTVLLLAGELDPALREDLAQAPLRAEHGDRVVACAVTIDDAGTRLELTPLQALEPGGRYALAVAGNARDARGDRLFATDAAAWIAELRVDDGASAGARVLSSWPAAGASSVATNLAELIVAFDGEVQQAERGVWLEGPDGLAVPAELEHGACNELAPAHAGRACVRLSGTGLLAPNAPYALLIGQDAVDAHGAPIGPFAARFRTASGPDDAPPQLLLPSCAIDETPVAVGCALIDDARIALRVRSDEPAFAWLHEQALLQSAGASKAREARAVAPAGDMRLELSSLAPDQPYAFTLELRDAAGNATEQRFELRTAPPLPALSIVEVRADPLGAEPAQELVELLNYGSAPIALAGLSLSDRLDASAPPLATTAVLGPAARALLVADGFDIHEPSEQQPPEGALLVRVGKSLASGGLRNDGEALFLRDAAGHRISAVPATPSPRPGVCVVRRIDADPRSGEPAAFERDPDDGCTPGY